MSAVWSLEQQRCLTELGYTLYRPAREPAAAAQPPPTRAGDAAPTQDPLLRALLRAVHRDCVHVEDAQAWLRAQQVQSLAQLRNDPAAKRALWPRLRMLRKESANQ